MMSDPIKFYKDGTTVNYDPELNPFINPEVWHKQDFDRNCIWFSLKQL